MPIPSGTLGQCQLHAHAEYDPPTFRGRCENPGNKEIIQQVDSVQARIDPVNAETEVKSSVRTFPRVYNRCVSPKKVKKTFGRG